MSGQATPGAPPRRRTARTVAVTLASAALGALLLAWLLPRATGVGWHRIGTALASASPLTLLALFALALGIALVNAAGLRGAVDGLPGRSALALSAASAALTVAVPGGSTLGLGVVYAGSRRAGVRCEAIVAGIAAATVAELMTGLLLVPLGVLCLLIAPSPAIGAGALTALVLLALASIAALVLGAAVLRPGPLAALLRGAGDGLGVLGLGERLSPGTVLGVRDAAAGRMRTHPLAVLGAPIAARALQLAAFGVALHAAGAGVGPAAAIAVFALGRALALVPLTPGGAGLVETGGAAALVALGAPAPPAAVAMLLQSLATLVAPLLLGALAAPVVLGSRSPGPDQVIEGDAPPAEGGS